MKVWENSKKLWKHCPAACVHTAFLVLPNFHLCFYNSIEKQEGFISSKMWENYTIPFTAVVESNFESVIVVQN